MVLNWGHCHCLYHYPMYRGLGEGTDLRLVKSFDLRGWALLGAAALVHRIARRVVTPAVRRMPARSLEERKMPMRFSWVACQPNCRGWVSAVGIVTADSPGDFDEFARGRELDGATIVLDSSGGSVNDAIALGRRWRGLGALTTVGISVRPIPHRAIAPASRPTPIANRCACSCCCRARRVTCPRLPMSGCIRYGWATAPTMPGRELHRAD